VRKGFTGNIYATPATRDLCAVMLADSAHIQQKEAEFLGRKSRSFVEPLYDRRDVDATMRQFVAVPKGRDFYLAKHVRARFHEAGHMLGSAGVVLDLEESGRKRRLGFSGDIGHVDHPLLQPLEPLPYIDALIMESTYGNVCHVPVKQRTAQLQEVVQETYRRGGKVVIPAFSVGRTQLIVYALHKLFNEGRLPAMPIYVDSPLSVNATEVFRLHVDELRPAVRAELERGEDPYGFSRLTYVRDVEESIRLNSLTKPCIVISSSGMCEHGRILHHLKNTIDEDRNTILIVGYQAENTLGRRIIDGATEVRILGKSYPVRARIAVLNGFSAHADQPELLAYVRACNGHGGLGRVFLVHGGENRAGWLAKAMGEEGLPSAYIPEPGETVEVN
jgi:metallo-beta-lactamase family protein